jgi:hypothetical protein
MFHRNMPAQLEIPLLDVTGAPGAQGTRRASVIRGVLPASHCISSPALSVAESLLISKEARGAAKKALLVKFLRKWRHADPNV